MELDTRAGSSFDSLRSLRTRILAGCSVSVEMDKPWERAARPSLKNRGWGALRVFVMERAQTPEPYVDREGKRASDLSGPPDRLRPQRVRHSR